MRTWLLGMANGLLGAVHYEIPKKGWMLTRDILLIVGIGMVLTVGLVFWATRYARHRKRRRHHSKPAILERHTEERADHEHPPHDHHHRRRRRRLRREHRGRNPTLAETGGLPPSRGESSGSSSAGTSG